MKTFLIAVLGSTILAVACSSNDAPIASMSETGDPSTTDPSTTARPTVEAASAVENSRPPDAAPARRAERASAVTTAPVERPSNAAGTSDSVRRVLEYREVTLPAGTMLAVRLTSSIASDSSEIEDAVRAALHEDVIVGGDVVLPAGAEVLGRVTDVERSGRVKGRARIAFRFTMLKHEGDEYDVRTEAIERLAEATKGEDATKIGIGAGAGAALGAILGGGSGAAKGAAIGAAAGTGAVLATRGEEVRLEPGTAVATRLTAAVPVRVRVK